MHYTVCVGMNSEDKILKSGVDSNDADAPLELNLATPFPPLLLPTVRTAPPSAKYFRSVGPLSFTSKHMCACKCNANRERESGILHLHDVVPGIQHRSLLFHNSTVLLWRVHATGPGTPV